MGTWRLFFMLPARAFNVVPPVRASAYTHGLFFVDNLDFEHLVELLYIHLHPDIRKRTKTHILA